MTCYTVAFQKGGSTKTTTAAEIVSALVKAGRRVLAIDLDEQGDFSSRLGVTQSTEVEAVSADVLAGERTLRDAAIPAPSVSGVHIVVGTIELQGIEYKHPDMKTIIWDELPDLEGEWDDVVIDTPASAGLVTQTAMTAADVIIASLACETEAIEKLPLFEEIIQKKIARRARPGQQLHWIIPTRYHVGYLLDGEILEALNKDYPGRVTRPVREAVAVRDSYTARMPLSVYAPESKVAHDYAEVIPQIIAPSLNKQTN